LVKSREKYFPAFSYSFFLEMPLATTHPHQAGYPVHPNASLFPSVIHLKAINFMAVFHCLSPAGFKS
jgi:hypothetical protein